MVAQRKVPGIEERPLAISRYRKLRTTVVRDRPVWPNSGYWLYIHIKNKPPLSIEGSLLLVLPGQKPRAHMDLFYDESF